MAGELGRGTVAPVHDAMAGPVPFNPLAREFVVEQGHRYRVGTFRWMHRPHVDLGQVRSYPRERPSHPAVQRAVETRWVAVSWDGLAIPHLRLSDSTGTASWCTSWICGTRVARVMGSDPCRCR